MKINDVYITNWQEPGGPWWNSVEANPSEPLIEATIKMTLSWLLARNRESRIAEQV